MPSLSAGGDVQGTSVVVCRCQASIPPLPSTREKATVRYSIAAPINSGNTDDAPTPSVGVSTVASLNAGNNDDVAAVTPLNMGKRGDAVSAVLPSTRGTVRPGGSRSCPAFRRRSPVGRTVYLLILPRMQHNEQAMNIYNPLLTFSRLVLVEKYGFQGGVRTASAGAQTYLR